ncbi:DUF4431 domain-containing protein [Glaesserella parasuis]|uniref:DUF4431 domain-containing protein n=1 Tax=Glaesserella parasuis TaxID=738 RepID=UPI0027226921|nr:hypothetical protein [Glaesserella parasuis]
MKRLFNLALVISLSSFSPIILAKNPVSVEYDTKVILEGTVKKESGYPMLYLPSPITAVANPESEGLYSTVKGAQKLQIVWLGDKLPTGCIIASGVLFGAHTIHHKTDVLIELESFKKCK